MKKKNLLMMAGCALLAGNLSAQTSQAGGELVSLLPEGVQANISTIRNLAKDKNLVVAGSPEKGYYAFFAATDTEHGEELWVTDGTQQGTRMVKDIVPGSQSSDVCYLTRFNDKVVFAATTDDYGTELWISDGTEAGTYMVKDIHEISSSNPRGFTQVNETQVVFAAQDFESEMHSEDGAQWWLWVTDGTEEGTKLIKKCMMKFPGQDNSTWKTPYCRVGRKVFFKADDVEGTMGGELWVTDGTEAGTKFVMDINTEEIASGTADSALDSFTNFYNEKLFFKAFSIESSNEPWASDGTPEGTYQIYDSNPTFDDTGFPRGGGCSDVAMYPYNGKIYFRGYSQETGCELAATNCEKGDFKIFDINVTDPTATHESFADPGVEFDGVYMFCANSGTDATIDSNHGGELWYTDGENVLKMQSDLGPGIQSNWVKDMTVCNGSLYWWNEAAGDMKVHLWRIDNKEQFPVQVTDFSADGDMIHSLRNCGGKLLFARSDANKGLYSYYYEKDGYNPDTDKDNLEPEYRTRQEIAGVVEEIATGETRVEVYPNPASDSFNFNVPGNVKDVKVYDLAGRLVLTDNGDDSNVEINGLGNGIYSVLITTDGGTYVSKLVVK